LQERYENAARAAYENCLALLDESKILAEHSRFARAYALCVLASEEFCKSFLYKGVSTGLAKEADIRKALVRHSEKITRFVHLIIVPYLLSTNTEEIKKAKEHDKSELDHAKHLYPKLMEEILGETSKRDEVVSIFSNAQELKMKSFYVDMKGQTLIVPTETIGKGEFDRIFGFLNGGLRGFEVVLGEDDEDFREIAGWFDPEFRYILKLTQ
jgi:AbiV family abortive infection protein